ncbi:MAG: hypothetical protein NC114_06520 [Ruminococcus flavefaciens]|nr:hypothetical protein [Ruminococcus flavefaciens]
MQSDMHVQSNSMRGKEVQDFVRRAVNEIIQDIAPAFGPGASDYFMSKDNGSYYTRDGKEIMESLTFDNELARQIHHILFQAAYRQAKSVGDGTTTTALFYGYLYNALYERLYGDSDALTVGEPVAKNINWIRREWKSVIEDLKSELKKISQPMTNKLLLSMLYTCTQDQELTATIYEKLREPIMAGAYIIPRKSNIASDFEMTTYMNPIFKATKQYILRDKNKFDHATILYCNGPLDIAHYEVLLGLMEKLMAEQDDDGNQRPISLDIIILCHGLTERTRQTLKELNRFLKSRQIDTNACNNLAIFTLDEYRNFSQEEIEDVATIITDEPGIGGLVQSLTFETLLYRAFYPVESAPPIEGLDQYDMDPHLITQMQTIFRTLCTVEFDVTEGMKIEKDLGPVALARYNQLRAEIEEEKSEIRKVSLNRRLKRSYGMFIDIQVGSALLKDSQRKYELILDAIISAATGVREGVIVGNSILHLMKIIADKMERKDLEISEAALNKEYVPPIPFLDAIMQALSKVMGVMIMNDAGEDYSDGHVDTYAQQIINMVTDPQYDISDFNLTTDDLMYWPMKRNAPPVKQIDVTVGDEVILIPNQVVEPLGIMTEVLENSILPVELLKAKVFHISGVAGYMNNFID